MPGKVPKLEIKVCLFLFFIFFFFKLSASVDSGSQLFWMNAYPPHNETSFRPLLSTLTPNSVLAPAPNPRTIPN